MNSSFTISILIITDKKTESPLIDHLKKLDSNGLDYEILLAVGKNPSVQRNRLAQRAKGKVLLFLDEDSRPVINLLEIYHRAYLKNPGCCILGGPSLIERQTGIVDNLTRLFFSSHFGSGPFLKRYNSIGDVSLASERDVILCNLMIEKKFFLGTKGFNKNHYPGEENEFFNNHDNQTPILHIPYATVTRPGRDTLVAFLRQMFSYGMGRSKNLKFKSTYDFFFLFPFFFSLYLVLLPFLLMQNRLWGVFLVIHLLLGFINALVKRHVKQSLVAPFFFLGGHFLYGLGVVVGTIFYRIFKRERNVGEIEIYLLKSFEKNYT